MTAPYQAFTLKSNGGVLRVLVTPCHACAAFDPAKVDPSNPPQFRPFRAIWDTGATGSVITQAVVDACGLKPIGMMQVHGVHGMGQVNTYLINVGLPNQVGVVNVEVTLGKLVDADMLIGMDIITRGDFSITNVGGNTVFSFRIPSMAAVDFVERANAPKDKHGGGKKHKHKKRPPKHFGKNKYRK